MSHHILTTAHVKNSIRSGHFVCCLTRVCLGDYTDGQILFLIDVSGVAKPPAMLHVALLSIEASAVDPRSRRKATGSEPLSRRTLLHAHWLSLAEADRRPTAKRLVELLIFCKNRRTTMLSQQLPDPDAQWRALTIGSEDLVETPVSILPCVFSPAAWQAREVLSLVRRQSPVLAPSYPLVPVNPCSTTLPKFTPYIPYQKAIMSKEASFTELAEIVSARTKTLNDYFQKAGKPQPTFAPGAPLDIIPDDEPELQKIRAELVDASRRIADYAAGSMRLSMEHMVLSQQNAAVLRFMYRFDVPHNVPFEGSISFDELAKKVGADVDILRRVTRFAYTLRLFSEPTPDHVAHTNFSYLLAKESDMWDMLGHSTEDMFPCMPFLSESQKKWPGSTKATETAFHLAFPDEVSEGKTVFEWYGENKDRAVRFGGAMKSISMGGGFVNNSATLNSFDWKALGKAKIVDVGGSRGHVSIALLRHCPELTAIVQDRPETVAQGEVPSDLTGRLSFEEANFFTEQQPIKDADVYYFRHIFHDWPDHDCKKILDNTIPSMKKGSRLIVSDWVVKPPGQESMFEEKMTRGFDLQMLIALSAKERTLEDWKELMGPGTEGQLEFELTHGRLVSFIKK
ncbi:hypothetical protein FH972_024465 [Carpinus fangiana]|uniref:O-methyltransferase C-terminal domain-containing protein n=1 Tax=Carpinus fangiana TaxID=176857 RepID=A0A5N6KYH1_9ROSI|nr:hypothetical protein FH972_024465 [Carpinus fangiana]